MKSIAGRMAALLLAAVLLLPFSALAETRDLGGLTFDVPEGFSPAEGATMALYYNEAQDAFLFAMRTTLMSESLDSATAYMSVLFFKESAAGEPVTVNDIDLQVLSGPIKNYPCAIGATCLAKAAAPTAYMIVYAAKSEEAFDEEIWTGILESLVRTELD